MRRLPLWVVSVAWLLEPIHAAGWERVQIKIGETVNIVPQGTRLVRGMLGIIRHPDGSIFVNTQTGGLARSRDQGKTWSLIPAEKAFALGVSRDGRLWLADGVKDASQLVVRHSSDSGETWTTTALDVSDLSPESSRRPYNWTGDDYNTFIERPDGTLMFSAGLRRIPWFYEDPSLMEDGLVSPDADVGGLFLFRSRDGGKSWGEPSLVHEFASEVGYAVDPADSDRILAMTRIQRPLLAGEDRSETLKKTGAPASIESNMPSIYKNGLLLESRDGGRTFAEVPGGLTGFYEIRGTIFWTADNRVVVTHQGAHPGGGPDGTLLARISLDGGRRWLDGTATGTTAMNQSRKFVLVPRPPGHSFTAPSVQISENRFLSVYFHGNLSRNIAMVSGVFWRLEHLP